MLTKLEHKTIEDELDNESWIEAMKEEIEQIERKKNWFRFYTSCHKRTLHILYQLSPPLL